MSKHTAEPWKFEIKAAKVEIQPDVAIVYVQPSRYDSSMSKTRVSNAARIVQCVNAMAGIADPDALVKSHGELVEALKNFENDDGHTPATIWEIRNTALANAAAIKGETK